MNKITGNGCPAYDLEASVGQFYEDLDTGNVYECQSITNVADTVTYNWVLRAHGEHIDDHAEIFGGGGGSASKYKQPEWGLESGGIVEILPQTSVGMEQVVSDFFVVATPLTNPIVVGNDYIIDYNGNQYTCKAWESVLPQGLVTVIGNGAAMGGNDTGEPFLIMVVPEEYVAEVGYLNVMAKPGTEEVTLSIMGEKREIHKIPSEYVEGDIVYIRRVDGNYHVYADKEGKNELTYAEGLKCLLHYKLICDMGEGDYLIPSMIHGDQESNKLEVVIAGRDTVYFIFSDSKGGTAT